MKGDFVLIELLQSNFKVYEEKIEELFTNTWEYVIGEFEFDKILKKELPTLSESEQYYFK